MAATNLDLDALRALATAMELGSFAQAAERLGRSPSALSLQMRKLESQTGRILLRKQGRGVALTEAGEMLWRYARRMLALNDEALAALAAPDAAGVVRIGMPQDYAESRLPPLLGAFARAYPAARVEATVERSGVLAEMVGRGALEVALVHRRTDAADHAGGGRGVDWAFLRRYPVCWIAAADFTVDEAEPLPLSILSPPCPFRDMALAALERAVRSWRIAFTGGGPAGAWAAAAAGLGVAVRPMESAPAGLIDAGGELGLPELPDIELWLATPRGAPLSPPTLLLRDLLVKYFSDRV